MEARVASTDAHNLFANELCQLGQLGWQTQFCYTCQNQLSQRKPGASNRSKLHVSRMGKKNKKTIASKCAMCLGPKSVCVALQSMSMNFLISSTSLLITHPLRDLLPPPRLPSTRNLETCWLVLGPALFRLLPDVSVPLQTLPVGDAGLCGDGSQVLDADGLHTSDD